MSTVIDTGKPGRARVRLGWAAAALAAALGVLAVVLAGSTLVFTLRSGEAAGEVIALEEARDSQGQVRVPVHYQAVVEFPDHNGQFRRFTDASLTDRPPAIGSEVRVLFDRKRPSRARIMDLDLMYRDSVTVGVAALVVGICAEELVRRPRRRRTDDQQLGPVQLLGNRAR